MVFFLEDLLEKPDDLSDCELETRTDASAAPAVTGVPVSPPSLVTECWEGISLDSGWELVQPQLQSFSFSEKRSVVLEENREEMSFEGTPEKASPATRRRKMLPTPQQGSHPLFEEMQWQADMEAQGSIWSARERTVIARIENYLDKSDDMKLEVGSWSF